MIGFNRTVVFNHRCEKLDAILLVELLRSQSDRATTTVMTMGSVFFHMKRNSFTRHAVQEEEELALLVVTDAEVVFELEEQTNIRHRMFSIDRSM